MKQLKIKTNLNKSEKYILTCSFGPDSMALFRYLLDNDFDFEVAHVNYHILAQSDSDCKKIVDFCGVFHKKVHILSTHMPSGVNEEEWARDVRYDYFDYLAKKTGITKILVAHNKSDLVETYIMQKQKGTHLYYGISENLTRKKSIIVRPLLNYTKDELLEFVLATNTPYSIDPSNTNPAFYRNKIRLDLRSLKPEEIEELFEKCMADNAKNERILAKYNPYFDEVYGFNFQEALKSGLKEDELHVLLIKYFKDKGIVAEISEGRAHEIYLKASAINRPSIDRINSRFNLYYEYGYLKIDEPHCKYECELNSMLSNDCFEINKDKLDEFMKTQNSRILIKNAVSAAFFEKNGQKTSINRLLSKMKVPLSIRDIWPGLFNENGELIYVPRFRKDSKKEGIISPNLTNLEKLTLVNCQKDIIEL